MGNITVYLWTKIAGPCGGTITTPDAVSTGVTGLVAGVYRFELRVTDNGAFGRDTVPDHGEQRQQYSAGCQRGADQTDTFTNQCCNTHGVSALIRMEQ